MASEQDFSDCSASSTSPQNYEYSPGSSPMQQVPELANVLSALRCTDTQFTDLKQGKPTLVIKEQPNGYFRFRYKSEMSGTHGCIVGSTSSRTKTHPSVELKNYLGAAIITCRLTQWNNEEDHPHQLLIDDRYEDVVVEVGPDKNYEVSFRGLGIIHPGKKNIEIEIYEKLQKNDLAKKFTQRELKYRSQQIVKNIELNIVRLKFCAYDPTTKEELCDPVFSEPIRNMKSAQTNDLKICRMSLCSGKVEGGDEIYLLVEKVNKKCIQVCFVELDEAGDVAWEADGFFAENDVHHQFAIVVKTPPYKNQYVTSDVRVYVELRRRSDGRASERLEYTYCAKPLLKLNKKRKANSYSSIGSSDGSLKSNSDIPASVNLLADASYGCGGENNIMMPQFKVRLPPSPTGDLLGDALTANLGRCGAGLGAGPGAGPRARGVDQSPLLCRGSAPELPVISLSSAELNIHSLLATDDHMPSSEIRRFLQETDLIEEYLKLSGSEPMIELMADSAHLKKELTKLQDESILLPKPIKIEVEEEPGAYSANYTLADGKEVKQILKDVCQGISKHSEDHLRTQLEKLFSLRLTNGDTFLFMALCWNLPSLQLVAKMLNQLGLARLLDLQNHRLQSVLHLAVLRRQPAQVGYLVAQGCDPMVADMRGDTAIHYAANDHACLEALLEAIKEKDLKVDLNAPNKEQKTALHIAAYYNHADAVKLLLSHGARAAARERDGRTPLHLAAYGDSLQAVNILLHHMPASDVNLWDAQGFSVLQVVCGSPIRQNTLAILELLLEHQADPMSNADNNKPAWVIARGKPEMMALLKPYTEMWGEEINIDDEDYESAEEEESQTALQGLPAYIDELSCILDRSGGWRELARRARCGPLLALYEAAPSPTRALLAQIRELPEQLSSASLALQLRDLGEPAAAAAVLRHLR